MQTMSLTIELPKMEVMFLNEYATRHHLSISELIYSLIEQFRVSEKKYVFHPEMQEILGLLPDVLDAKEVYYQHIQEKHQ